MDTPPVRTAFAAQLKRIRAQRRWTQDDLANHLKEAGHPVSRPVIAKLELGQRALLVEDLIGFAIALGVPPVSLLVEPDDDRPAYVTSTTTTTVAVFRNWWEGKGPLDAAPTLEARRRYFDEASLGQWHARKRYPVVQVLSDLAVEAEAAAGTDDLTTLRLRLEAARDEIDRELTAISRAEGATTNARSKATKKKRGASDGIN